MPTQGIPPALSAEDVEWLRWLSVEANREADFLADMEDVGERYHALRDRAKYLAGFADRVASLLSLRWGGWMSSHMGTDLPLLPLGSTVTIGDEALQVGMVGNLGGERYYWLIGGKDHVVMYPATVVHGLAFPEPPQQERGE